MWHGLHDSSLGVARHTYKHTYTYMHTVANTRPVMRHYFLEQPWSASVVSTTNTSCICMYIHTSEPLIHTYAHTCIHTLEPCLPKQSIYIDVSKWPEATFFHTDRFKLRLRQYYAIYHGCSRIPINAHADEMLQDSEGHFLALSINLYHTMFVPVVSKTPFLYPKRCIVFYGWLHRWTWAPHVYVCIYAHSYILHVSMCLCVCVCVCASRHARLVSLQDVSPTCVCMSTYIYICVYVVCVYVCVYAYHGVHDWLRHRT
jgi:hypothetical protein